MQSVIPKLATPSRLLTHNTVGRTATYIVTKRKTLLQAPPVIHTPHALPMFKEAKHIRKRKSEKDRDDAVKFHKPEVGSSAATLGRGAAGLIGKTGGTLLTQYVLKNHVSLPVLLLSC